jgi:hypothetical protein
MHAESRCLKPHVIAGWGNSKARVGGNERSRTVVDLCWSHSTQGEGVDTICITGDRWVIEKIMLDIFPQED